MPDKKDKEFVSFADAHDDWIRKNTPGSAARLRKSWVFPPPGTSALGTFLGCFWRIALFAGTIMVGGGLAIKLHLAGDTFADAMESEIQSLLKAEEVTIPALRWKNRVGLISSLEARGSAESFFHTLSADGIRFHLPWLMAFKDQWDLESVSMLGFDIVLDEELPPPAAVETETRTKSDAEKESDADADTDAGREDADAVEKEKPAAPGAALPAKRVHPAIAGFGIHPHLDRVRYEALHAEEGTFRWGVAPTSAGSLKEAEMTLTRAGTGFSLIFNSGTLNQNWLKDLAITKLSLRVEPGVVLIDECEFRLGDSGTGTLRGKIATGEIPKIAVQAELKSVNLEDILPNNYMHHTAGIVDLSLRFTGSTTTPEGVVCEGTVKVTEALVRNIPAFEAMTTIYADPRFRRLKITGGTVAFTTKNGLVEISNLELTCGDFARIQADLRMVDPEEQIFSGTLNFGIRRDVVKRYPQITDTHFARVEGDFRWATTPLQGPVAQLTKELSASMASAMREINQRKNRPAP